MSPSQVNSGLLSPPSSSVRLLLPSTITKPDFANTNVGTHRRGRTGEKPQRFSYKEIKKLRMSRDKSGHWPSNSRSPLEGGKDSSSVSPMRKEDIDNNEISKKLVLNQSKSKILMKSYLSQNQSNKNQNYNQVNDKIQSANFKDSDSSVKQETDQINIHQLSQPEVQAATGHQTKQQWENSERKQSETKTKSQIQLEEKLLLQDKKQIERKNGVLGNNKLLQRNHYSQMQLMYNQENLNGIKKDAIQQDFVDKESLNSKQFAFQSSIHQNGEENQDYSLSVLNLLGTSFQKQAQLEKHESQQQASNMNKQQRMLTTLANKKSFEQIQEVPNYMEASNLLSSNKIHDNIIKNDNKQHQDLKASLTQAQNSNQKNDLSTEDVDDRPEHTGRGKDQRPTAIPPTSQPIIKNQGQGNPRKAEDIFLGDLIQKSRQTPDSLQALQSYLSTKEIPCQKYHYTVNGGPIIFDNYKATFRVSKDGKQIILHTFKPEEDTKAQEKRMKLHNKQRKLLQKQINAERGLTGSNDINKELNESISSSSSCDDDKDSQQSFNEPLGLEGIKRKKKTTDEDENIKYARHKSNGTCNVDDIEGFIYGANSSRFWMMRKHINSMDVTKGVELHLPFYNWQCLTLQLPHRDIDLVIQNENHMKIILQFLILELQTVDGLRGTAKPQLNHIFEIQTKGDRNEHRLFCSKDYEIEHLRRYNMQVLSEKVAKKLVLLKTRMKISFMAFQKNQTIYELFLKTIYDVYHQRKNAGLVEDPWPDVKKSILKKLLVSQHVDGEGNVANGEGSAEEDGQEDEDKKTETQNAASAVAPVDDVPAPDNSPKSKTPITLPDDFVERANMLRKNLQAGNNNDAAERTGPKSATEDRNIYSGASQSNTKLANKWKAVKSSELSKQGSAKVNRQDLIQTQQPTPNSPQSPSSPQQNQQQPIQKDPAHAPLRWKDKEVQAAPMGLFKQLRIFSNAEVEERPERCPRNFQKIAFMKHIEMGMNKNKSEDIFKDILIKADQQMPVDQIVRSYVKFKFKKAKIILDIQKLRILQKMRLVIGPLNIVFQLKIIELEKELFAMALERGHEVRIPTSLDQSRLPQSYRYYDPIINIIKQNFTGQKRDFLKLKKSISYAFDQKYQANSLFKKKLDQGTGKLKAQHTIRAKRDTKFDFINSMHTMQVQNSKYLKIDDDFVNHASRIQKELERDGTNLNKYQREQILFDMLGQIHVKYLDQKKLVDDRKKVLTTKIRFSQQMTNLKEKGKRLTLLQKINSEIMDQYEDRMDTMVPTPAEAFSSNNQEVNQGSRSIKDNTLNSPISRVRAANNLQPQIMSIQGGQGTQGIQCSFQNNDLNSNNITNNNSLDHVRVAGIHHSGGQSLEASKLDGAAGGFASNGGGPTQPGTIIKQSTQRVQEDFQNQLKERSEASTGVLFDELSVAFRERFLPAASSTPAGRPSNNGNREKAMKKQKEEVFLQAQILTDINCNKKLQHQRDELKNYFKENRKNYEKKQSYLDERIEQDILYFNTNYESKQEEIRIINSMLRRNLRLMEENQRQKQLRGELKDQNEWTWHKRHSKGSCPQELKKQTQQEQQV